MVSDVLVCQASEQLREAGGQLFSVSALERRGGPVPHGRSCIIGPMKSSFNDLLLPEQDQSKMDSTTYLKKF